MAPDDAPQSPVAYVFYDYACPYAYVGKLRADALERDLDVRFEWLPWEIYATTSPRGEGLGDAYEPGPVRGWVGDLAEELDAELTRPPAAINTNFALRGAEYAKDQGGDAFRRYHDLAFEAVWVEGRNLSDPDVIRDVVEGAGLDAQDFTEAVWHHAYQARLDAVDEAAEKLGIQRVPTFVFGDQRIVGNDPFEASLRGPLEAFLERWKAKGPDACSTLAEDVGLARILEL